MGLQLQTNDLLKGGNGMNELTRIFEGSELTIIENEGEPSFLLKDVCEILEIGNHRHVRTRLEDDVVSNYPIRDSIGRTQQATFVNEDGLYDVILDSRKPEAKKFRKWITSEVLPSIRKTGKYDDPKILSEKEQLVASMKLSIEHTERITEHDERIANLEDNMRMSGAEEYRIHSNAKKKVVECLGGKDAKAYKEISRKAFAKFWNEFKCHFEIPRYGELPTKRFDEGLFFIDAWQPDTSMRLEIKALNNQESMVLEDEAQ